MRTPSEHKIDTFSLVEDGRKDACVGMDSLKFVDFVGCVEWKTLGTGESYCVLPSHLSYVRGLKQEYGFSKRGIRKHRTLRGCVDRKKDTSWFKNLLIKRRC